MDKELNVRVGGLEKTVEGHSSLLKEHAKELVEHATDIIMIRDSVERNTKAHEKLLESHKETNAHLSELVGGMKAMKWFIPLILTVVGAIATWL